jgi:hypothetical protein
VNCKAGEGSPGQQLKRQALYSMLYGTYSLKTRQIEGQIIYIFDRGFTSILSPIFIRTFAIIMTHNPSEIIRFSLQVN